MSKAHSKVAFGYLPNFKGDRTLLFAGNERALEEFAAYLEDLVKVPTNVTMMLDKEPLFLPKRGIRLTLTISDSPLGMRRMAADSTEPHFEWRISKELAAQFAQLMRAVASMDKPSHQYLDANGDEIVVMVSKGEYEEAWLQQQT